jgi:hypothetical protein
MGRYLEIFRQEPANCEKSELSEKTHAGHSVDDQARDLIRFSRFFRPFHELERRCPLHVGPAEWQQAVEDGSKFLARWGERADALGWTAWELFGLPSMPEHPKPNYRRLSRYDETGLIWLLRGRPVMALTETEAAIRGATAVLVYRKVRNPALGPVGDSLDDMGAVS